MTVRLFVALAIGALFGAGLALSAMIDPARVLGFLDLAGRWDPTLAFVMGGALIPSAIAYRWRRAMDRPRLADDFAVPEAAPIDRQLISGAVLFGVGWGLVGLCPGPALAALLLGGWPVLVFVAALVVGMTVHDRLWDRAA
jgi:uncharacterized protein